MNITHDIKMWTTLIFLVAFCLTEASGTRNGNLTRQENQACYSFSKPGDLIIGGLFRVTDDSPRGLCRGSTRRDSVLRTAQAMEFAIEQINNRADLLPNVTLGYDLRDDCASEELSLWQTLSLVSPGSSATFKGLCSVDAPAASPVVGLIGTGSSDTTVPVSKLGSLLDVPVVSYGATSDELGDRQRFGHLLRTSTPDRVRTEAILDILGHFGWVYVALLYSADREGIHDAMEFEAMAEKRNVCLALSSYIRESATLADHQEIVAEMAQFNHSTIIVTFLNQDDALDVLRAFRQAGYKHRYIWVTAQMWPNSLTTHHLDEIVSGGIFLEVKNDPVSEFREYVTSLASKPRNTLSAWLEEAVEMYMESNNCTSRLCAFQGTLPGEETPVVNAVRAFGHALHAYTDAFCANRQQCLYPNRIDGTKLLSLLKDVSFTTTGGTFSFNEYGDAGGGYKVNNYQEVDGTYEMVEIGTWGSSTPGLVLNETLIRWQKGSRVTPRSNCLQVCPAGFFPKAGEVKCCVTCRPCPGAAIVNGSRCENCEVMEWPNKNRTSCVSITATPLNYRDPLVISILVISALGITLCVLIAVVGITCYWDHPLIKASSRELSSVNILGLLSCFATAVVILLPPTTCTCILAETGIVFSVTLTFSSTLLKVVRIYRIFQAGRKSVKRPRFTTPKAQMTMTSLIVFIQMMLVLTSILTSPSAPERLTRITPGHKPVVEVYCQFGAGFCATGLFNVLLILGSCWAAFKARKVPSNYNESKFIAVSVYSTLVLCLAAVPVYTTGVAILQKVATLCLTVQLNAMLALACVYLPKLCAIRCVKEGLAISICNSNLSQGPASSHDCPVDANRVHPIPSTVGWY